MNETNEVDTKDKKPVKLALVNSTFTTEQLLRMVQRTPKNHIYQRKGKGGGMWDYVTGVYTKKTLNFVFGFLWSTSILKTEEKYGQVIAHVRLHILNREGNEILHKDDVGKKDIVMRADKSGPLDYGNDEKAAVTDGLKRCAAQLGIASDVYGKEEFKEIDSSNVEMPEADDDLETTGSRRAMIDSLAKKLNKVVVIPEKNKEAKLMIKTLTEEIMKGEK